MDTNKIIASGLVVMGVISVLGWAWLSLKTGTSTGTEIPIGIISGLVGVLTGKGMAEAKGQESKTAETLDKVAKATGEAKQIVSAMETIKDTAKK